MRAGKQTAILGALGAALAIAAFGEEQGARAGEAAACRIPERDERVRLQPR